MANGLPYNGWTALVRNGPRYAAYERARRWGVLPPAAACICCRTALPAGATPYHAEEYGPTHEDFWRSCVPMCHRCHAWLHARFRLPNLWRLLVSQASEGNIDEERFPPRGGVSKIRAQSDTSQQRLTSGVSDYFTQLPMEENRGPWKPATLLVRSLNGQTELEVPDWEVYGERLERATTDEISGLRTRGVAVEDFVAGRLPLERDADGRLWYDPLYRPRSRRRPLRRRFAKS